jgi:hypothetical protein
MMNSGTDKDVLIVRMVVVVVATWVVLKYFNALRMRFMIKAQVSASIALKVALFALYRGHMVLIAVLA